MRVLAPLLLALLATSASAQVAVTSPRPERVGVTIYRDLSRGSSQPQRNWLNGYALISEVRTVTIPAGESDLRFEGVASGIIPQSAIVTGIPEGLLERNRDAYLLSARSLIDRNLGQRVTLRRTERATGKEVRQDAILRTGSDGGVVLQTPAGFEALRCSGLSETPLFDRVPAGLSAKPTLSVRVRAHQPLTATVTLSYLATGFDWQADYVGVLSPDERTLQLQAWLTLASTDETSFVGATTQAVAGRVNREDAEVPPVEAPPIRLACWPQGTTSDIPEAESYAQGYGGPPPPPPPPPPMMSPAPVTTISEDIVVTGARVTAERERLGDLQLYRIPEPVTVAAKAQKQVGLLDRPAVKVTPIYKLLFSASDKKYDQVAQLVLRSRNREAEGLGLPLPAGNVVLFRQGSTRPMLIGEGPLDDTAVGEKVELRLAEANGVRGRLKSDDKDRRTLTLTNDRAVPIVAEVQLYLDDDERIRADRKLARRDGNTYWDVTVPANGQAVLTYRLDDQAG